MNNRSFNEVETIILGAGISGLTLGHYLNKRDKDFYKGLGTFFPK